MRTKSEKDLESALHAYRRRAEKYKELSDELLEACRRLLQAGTVQMSRTDGGALQIMCTAREQACKVIAKAEGSNHEAGE